MGSQNSRRRSLLPNGVDVVKPNQMMKLALSGNLWIDWGIHHISTVQVASLCFLWLPTNIAANKTLRDRREMMQKKWKEHCKFESGTDCNCLLFHCGIWSHFLSFSMSSSWGAAFNALLLPSLQTDSPHFQHGTQYFGMFFNLMCFLDICSASTSLLFWTNWSEPFHASRKSFSGAPGRQNLQWQWSKKAAANINCNHEEALPEICSLASN